MASHESTRDNPAQKTEPESNTRPITDAAINMVIQTIDGTAELHRVLIKTTATDSEAFECLRTEIKKSMSWTLRFFCFLRVVSVVPCIAVYTLDDDSSESQNFPADVLVHNHRFNRSFTERFSNPKSEHPVPPNRFISRHRNLTTSSTSNEALVFRLVINRMQVLRIIAGVFFAAPLLGIVVGFLCGHPDIGMETSNAIFAMIPAMVASCALVLVERGNLAGCN